MTVLVTGAAGFIGSHVVDRLLASGVEVVGLDNFDDFYDPDMKERNLDSARSSDRFREVRGDIRDPRTLEQVPAGTEVVIHLAARPGVRPSIEDPSLYASVNIEGTLRVLDFARDRAIRRMLYASSSSVYGDSASVPFTESDPADRPISPYAATKRAGELLCHAYHHLFGLSVVVLRFFTVFGPRQRPDLAIHKFARLMREGEAIPVYGDGTSERDYTFVTDVVHGVLGALDYVRRVDTTYQIFNLGGNRTVSLDRMVEILGQEMGIRPAFDRLPPRPGDVQSTFADVAKAGRLLGYEPRTDFREGIRAFLEWFEGEGAETTGSRQARRS
jgi:UDP-glucuronate 4-epimerase